MTVPGWPTVFRGSDAVAAGLVTWAELRGPRFRRQLPDTYVAVGPRNTAGPRNVADRRNPADRRKPASPRGTTGPRDTAEPGGTADTRDAAGARNAAGARTPVGLRGTGGPRTPAGPRGAGDPRSATRARSAADPRDPAEPRKPADPRNARGPREAAGARNAAGMRTPAGSRTPVSPRGTAGRLDDLTLRSHAAFRWSRGRGVLSGYSAAELLDASCAPFGEPAEITVEEHVLRSRDGVVVRRGTLPPGEVTTVDGLRVTTPLRTAFDLGRRLDPVEAVVAVDALANRWTFSPDLLLNFAVRYPHTRGVDRLADVLSLADARSGSPPETRLRLVLVQAGLPAPAVQHPVVDDDRRRAVWLDLAYPRQRLGIEYDGGDHLQPEQVRKDIERHTRLAAAGWRVLRYTRRDIRHDPARIAREVARALGIPAAG